MVRTAKDKIRGKVESQWPFLVDEVLNLYKVNKNCIQTLMAIISDDDYDQFVNVYQMNTDGCGADIEQSILNALSKGIRAFIFI